MDEATPHMHIIFIPVIKSKDKNGKTINKIACSEYRKGKDSYKKLRDNFYKYITENDFYLERGKERKIEHLSTEKLKQITNYDNIKYELSHQEIKPLNLQNTALILAQNQELVKYVNKLKIQLSKSFRAMNKLQEIQKENINLKCENEKLKQENHSLKNYINKTFKFVKQLFDFPKDSFKRLVDNFVKNFYKDI